MLGGDWDQDDHGVLVYDRDPIAFRGIFLIDREGIVCHEYINFCPSVTNIHDTLRVIDALRYAREHGDVYPSSTEESREL